MTVQELIDHLETFSPESSVVVEVREQQEDDRYVVNQLVSLQKSDICFYRGDIVITPN